MYRIFCESYDNFLKSFDGNSVRLKMTKPIELITDINRYKKEKEKESILYKKACDLIYFMQENTNRFPRFKAFLWTLNARNMNPKKYNISELEELEEQSKLINSFLKLAYWY